MKYRVLLVILLFVSPFAGCAYQSSLDLYLRGQIAAEQGNLPMAMTALSKAIDKNPRLSVAYMARGNLLQKQGNYEEAARDYQQAVNIEPYNFTANFQLGVIYQHLKKFAEAVKAYEQALQTRPLDEQANMNLALTYMQMGNVIGGLVYGQHAVQADDTSAMAHANLGVLYSQAQFHSAAIDEFKKSIELDSKQPEVYLNLGQEYFSMNAFEQARNVLETAKALTPSVRVYERLGATYYRLRQYDMAEVAFRGAVGMEGKDVASLNGLGATLMSQSLLASGGNVELAKAAIGFWNKSLEIDGNQLVIKGLVEKYMPHE